MRLIYRRISEIFTPAPGTIESGDVCPHIFDNKHTPEMLDHPLRPVVWAKEGRNAKKCIRVPAGLSSKFRVCKMQEKEIVI